MEEKYADCIIIRLESMSFVSDILASQFQMSKIEN